MQQADYHHANISADKLRAHLQLQGSEILAMVQGIAEFNTTNTSRQRTTPTSSLGEYAHSIIHSIGNASAPTNISAQNSHYSGRDGLGGRNECTGCGIGERRIGIRTPDNTSFNRYDQSNYCHTHGAYNHILGDRTKKSLGHQDRSTFDNRMGGSNIF